MKNITKKILTIPLAIFLTTSQSYAVMGVGDVVFDPTSYASLLESIEKYNTMIKNMQDTLDTMNRINDLMNTSTNMLNNLQTGIANPNQLINRFQSNLNRLQNNFNSLSDNIKDKDWKDSILQNQYASCKDKWQKLRKQYGEIYKNNQFAMEIDANLAWLDSVNNDGLANANKDIHKFFDNVVNKMDITDIEAKIANNKNPKETTIRICRLIEEEELKQARNDAIKDYHQAVVNKDRQKADEALNRIKQIDVAIYQNKVTKIENNIGTYNNYTNFQNDKPIVLSYNEQTCELNNQQEWESTLGNTDINHITEKVNIKVDGSTSRQVCIVRQEIINDIFKKGRINEAISLQNQRNMALALNGDTYALQQAQLETLGFISKQISVLNDSVNVIAKLNLDELEQRKEQLENQKTEFGKDDNIMFKNWINPSTERSFEYNKYGLPVRKKPIENIIGD